MPSPGPFELIIILAIVAIFVVPILLIIAFASRGRPSVVATPAPARDPALDALRTRLAAGEIDEAEYQRLRATLQAS